MIQPVLKPVSVITVNVGAEQHHAVIVQRVVIKRILRCEVDQAAARIDGMAQQIQQPEPQPEPPKAGPVPGM